MATYKKIVDVETMAEATETTNVLVENAGSLMKVPASAIGGSDERVYVVTYDSESGVYSANMTFEEFTELFDSKKLVGAQIFDYNSGYLTIHHCHSICNYGSYCYMYSVDGNGYTQRCVNIYSNGTIENGDIPT